MEVTRNGTTYSTDGSICQGIPNHEGKCTSWIGGGKDFEALRELMVKEGK